VRREPQCIPKLANCTLLASTVRKGMSLHSWNPLLPCHAKVADSIMTIFSLLQAPTTREQRVNDQCTMN
jgi:hypothetical protein